MFDVITIGTATRDVFLSGAAFKVVRDPKHLSGIGFPTGEAECFALGSKLDVEKPLFTTGGGAVNAAITFKRQALKVASLVRVGDDVRGEDVVTTLKQAGVQPLAIRSAKEGTAYSTILLTSGGERTVLVYRGASESLQKKEVPFSKLSATWAYIVPGSIDFSVMSEIVTFLKKKGTKIAMNPSRHYLETHGAHLKPMLRQLDVVILNREEAALLTGAAYAKDREIFRKLDGIVPGIAVMTDGARGARASDGTYLYSVGIFKEKKVVDRTGAGDAFGSGFVAGLMTHDGGVHDALRIASANATSVVEHVGAHEGALTKKELAGKRWQGTLDLDVDPL